MTIRYSRKYVYITNPYFIPPPDIQDALITASRRGVDVRVINAGASDVPIVQFGSQHLYLKLLQ